MINIKKETFMDMDTHTQMGVLFDILQATHVKVGKLEKRKWLHLTASGIGGAVGIFLLALFRIKIF